MLTYQSPNISKALLTVTKMLKRFIDWVFVAAYAFSILSFFVAILFALVTGKAHKPFLFQSGAAMIVTHFYVMTLFSKKHL